MTTANEKPNDLISALDDLREENRILCEAKGWPPLTGEITVYGLTLAEIRKLKRDSLRRAQPTEAVDEDKEREAFEGWCAKENTVPRFKESYWKIWLARARGGN